LPVFSGPIALANGEVITFTKLANDCQVAASTVREHVVLLEDTLVGFFLPAWAESRKRKALSQASLFF